MYVRPYVKPTITFEVRALKGERVVASFNTDEEARDYLNKRRDPSTGKPFNRIIRVVRNEYEIAA